MHNLKENNERNKYGTLSIMSKFNIPKISPFFHNIGK